MRNIRRSDFITIVEVGVKKEKGDCKSGGLKSEKDSIGKQIKKDIINLVD